MSEAPARRLEPALAVGLSRRPGNPTNGTVERPAAWGEIVWGQALAKPLPDVRTQTHLPWPPCSGTEAMAGRVRSGAGGGGRAGGHKGRGGGGAAAPPPPGPEAARLPRGLRETAALLRDNGYGVLNEEKLRPGHHHDEQPPAGRQQQQQQRTVRPSARRVAQPVRAVAAPEKQGPLIIDGQVLHSAKQEQMDVINSMGQYAGERASRQESGGGE